MNIKYRYTELFREKYLGLRNCRRHNVVVLITYGFKPGRQLCRAGVLHLVEKARFVSLTFGVEALKSGQYDSLNLNFKSKKEAMAFFETFKHLLLDEPADTGAPTI